MDKEGRRVLSPPDKLDKWFEGEINGLEAMFEAKLKKRAWHCCLK
jgi:hypothetical protein